MTIAIGFRYSGGVLVCSDSLYTVGTLKLNGKKVFRAAVGSERIVFALAGSVPFASMAIEKCLREISAIPAEERTKIAMRDATESVLRDVFQQHIYPHPRHGTMDGPGFELAIGAWSHIDGLDFFYTSESAPATILDYHCLGCGHDFAHFILKSISRHPYLPLNTAASVAVHILRLVKERVSYCGGANQFAYLTKEGEMGSGSSLDLTGIEEISAALSSQAAKDVYRVAVDMESADEQLAGKLDTLATILQATREKVRSDREQFKGFTDHVKESADVLSPPDFKFD